MSRQPTRNQYKDTAASRKRRLQERLQEISEKSEQDLKALIDSLEDLKKTLKPKLTLVASNQTGGAKTKVTNGSR